MALFNRLGGMFTDNPVNRVGPTGQPLMGGSNITDLLTRSAGGLLGVDVRNPQEKLQAEMAQVKDPMSVEGMLKRAQILANTGDPKALMTATALANEARQLRLARTTKENIEKGRTGDIAFLKENPEYSDYVDDYKSFAVGPEFVAKLRQEKVAEEAAKRAAGISKTQRTTAYTSLGKLYNVPQEDQAAIEAGDLSYLEVEDFKKLYKPENQKAETVNFEVYNDRTDPTKGTKIIALSQREDSKVLDPVTREWKHIYDIGVLRETRAVETDEGEEGLGQKEIFTAQSQGATQSLAKSLSGLSQAERFAVLTAAGSPKSKAALDILGSDLGKKAGQTQLATDRIVETVARDLSGAAIKVDERAEFARLLTPVPTDFADPDLIFAKLANNYVGFAVANQLGFTPNTKDGATGERNAAVLREALSKVASEPVTPQIQKLVDEGNFAQALEIRKNQLLGGVDRSKETREQRLARIRAEVAALKN